MVRASASSLAAVSAAETDASTSPASRVADLGEFFDQSLKIHEPAAAEEPTNATAEKFAIPFVNADIPKAFVFVRPAVESLDGSDRFEAAVFFDGEFVDSDTFPNRRAAILGIQGLLFNFVSRQRHQSATMAAAARELNAAIKNQMDANEEIPAGEPCEWPIDDPQEPSLEGQDDGNASGIAEPTEQAPLPADAAADAAGEACGEVGVAASLEAAGIAVADAPVAPVESAEDRAARIKLAREVAEADYRRQYQAASEDYIQASAECAGAEVSLKEAKAAKKDAWVVLEALRNRGPRYLPLIDAAEAAKQQSGDTAATTTAPAFPSHDPLPPPVAESSHLPQAGEPEANSEAAEAAAAPPARDWQTVSIDELGLPPKLAERIREAGCPTIGKLESLRGSFEGLKSIAGIGQAKADQIEEAVLGWLSRNRDASTLSAAKEAAVAGEAVALEAAAQGQ